MLKMVNAVPFVVSAKLVKAVEFKRRGHWFTAGEGTEITLDADTNIGLIDGYHVQLHEADYAVLAQH